MDVQEKVGLRYGLEAGLEINQKAKVNFVIESETTITLKVGTNFNHTSRPAGIFIVGTVVVITSTGSFSPTPGPGMFPEIPADPEEADGAEAGQQAELPPPKKKTSNAEFLQRGRGDSAKSGAGRNDPSRRSTKDKCDDDRRDCRISWRAPVLR
jgi:hypothetical protein